MGEPEEQLDVAIVGAGQAGLVAGYHLRDTALRLAIFDANARVGDSWRARWDSLTLFSAARYSELPGMRIDGQRDRFIGKDEVAEHLEQYATQYDLPVRTATRVEALETAAEGFELRTSSGQVWARQVILATGGYQRPTVPSFADQLDDQVVQLHSTDYRNPSQLPPGRILVVGGANSGVQIAEELAATHDVTLAVGTKPRRAPLRIAGRPLHWWAELLGLISAPNDTFRGKLLAGDRELLIGTSIRTLRRKHGVRLVDRVADAQAQTLTTEKGTKLDPAAVIWATGYRPDFSWVEPTIVDEDGKPIHRRGVTDTPGLYLLGLKWQYSLGSSLIGWVGLDARFIADQVISRARLLRGN